MKRIKLSQDESKTFYDVISSELKCVINEYDDDTGRCPSRQRLENGKYAKAIIEKWEQTQPRISNTRFINLDATTACELGLSDEEIRYSKNLLDKTEKEIRNYLAKCPKPYTGFFLVMDEMANTANAINSRI